MSSRFAYLGITIVLCGYAILDRPDSPHTVLLAGIFMIMANLEGIKEKL